MSSMDSKSIQLDIRSFWAWTVSIYRKTSDRPRKILKLVCTSKRPKLAGASAKIKLLGKFCALKSSLVRLRARVII